MSTLHPKHLITAARAGVRSLVVVNSVERACLIVELESLTSDGFDVVRASGRECVRHRSGGEIRIVSSNAGVHGHTADTVFLSKAKATPDMVEAVNVAAPEVIYID